MKFDENRIEYTNRGFSYVKVKPSEIFNWGGRCICNSCFNQFAKDDMYLVYVLTDTYCEECFNDWLKRQNRYSQEDVDYDLEIQKDSDTKWYKFYIEGGNYEKTNG